MSGADNHPLGRCPYCGRYDADNFVIGATSATNATYWTIDGTYGDFQYMPDDEIDKKALSIQLSELRGDKIPPRVDVMHPNFIMFRKPLEYLQHHRRAFTRQ